MGIFSKIGKSADLMQGLADRMHVDLGAGMLAEPERAAQIYRTMVLRCSQCGNQDCCATLQAEREHIAQAPEYCRNRQSLNAKRH